MQTINSFVKGLDQDTNIKQINNAALRDAVNISIFENDNYGAIRAMLGTKFSAYTQRPIEAITAYCKKGNKNVFGIVVFTYGGSIVFYDHQDDSAITLINGLNFSTNISATFYSDRNANTLYWTDGESTMRKLLLDADNPQRPSLRAMSLRQLAPIDIIRFKEVRENGSLFAGSYIIFYRYYNSNDCSSSTISNATTVICIAPEVDGVVRGGIVGEPVNKQIVLEIDTAIGLENFDSVQLLVIKNINGSKVAQTSGYLTEPRRDWINGEIVYSGVGKEIKVDLASFITEDLAITTATSLLIDTQTMYLGGFKLNQFMGDPKVVSASLLTEEIDTYGNEKAASTKVGHFRDEVYAYAAKYTDDYGNSIAIPLDLSGQSGNKSSSWTWRFPNRQESNILTPEGKINVLGLNIAVTNHPTWARNIEIVRRERIRDIIGQTPHIPLIGVQGSPTSLIWEEITVPGEGAVKREVIDYEKNFDFVIPKVHGLGIARNLLSNRDENIVWEDMKLWHYSEWDRQYQISGGREVSSLMFAMVPEFLYTYDDQALRVDEAGGYMAKIIDGVIYKRRKIFEELSKEANEKDVLDLVIKRCNVFTAAEPGQYLNRDGAIVDGGFITLNNLGDLLNLVTQLDPYKDIIRESTQISHQIPQPLAATGQTLANKAFDDVDIKLYGFLKDLSLQQYKHDSVPASIAEFFSPSYKNQRGMIMRLAKPVMDFTLYAFINGAQLFDIDFPINYNSRTDIPTTNKQNKLSLGDDPSKGYLNNMGAEDGEGICAGWVMNIQKGLGDDRYGSIGSGGEWITTGAAKVISNPSETISFEVFGGDCFINKHSLKVHETTPKPIAYKPFLDFLGEQTRAEGFSINDIIGGALSAWTNNSQTYLSKTGAYRKNIEVLDVWLESTVNADLAAIKSRYPAEDEGKMNNFDDDWEYYYHPQYSASNNVKIYVGREDLCKGENNFPHGIAHSDIRVRGGQSNPFVDIYGFDQYRVNNFKVFDAQYGNIVTIKTFGDRSLYIFQERGIAYQGLGIELIRDADGVMIATGTGEVFAKDVFYNSAEVGTQHKNTVRAYNGILYGVDVLRRKIYSFASRFSGFKFISDEYNDSYFDRFLYGNIHAFIDQYYERYIVVNNTEPQKAMAWNTKAGVWETKIQSKDIEYGISVDVTVIWWNLGNAHKAYQGPRGYFFGSNEEVKFKFAVNAHPTVAKVFQSIHANAIGDMDILQCVVPHESQEQDTGVLPFQYYHKNHQYWQNFLRDSNHPTRAKLRGEVMMVEIFIRSLETIITSIQTNLRQSL